LKKRPKTPDLKAELTTGDGEVLGWAYAAAAVARIVTIRHRGTEIAAARACLFRPDLLRAGFGHGHYGFRARLRQSLPAGRVPLTLSCGDISVSVRMDVPPQTGAAPCTVEALVAPPTSWTAADLLSHPGCLPWENYLAAMGGAHFIDAAFRFALHRWPSGAEAGVHARALARGSITAEGLVARLLRSHERADMKPSLMSPHDPDFLFDSGCFPGTSPGNLDAHAR